jgi:hypothetical protein
MTTRRTIPPQGRSRRGAPLAALALLLGAALLLAACEDSDPTAPEGSSISVTADPQTTQPNVPVRITATVRSGNGTRLPDQEVIFSTSQGTLDPPAQTSLITDDIGQVTSTLRTPSTATVTARSGSITNTTSVNIVNCQLQDIIITDISPSQINDCNGSAQITVTAIDTNGAGCGGVVIVFYADPPGSGQPELSGSLNPPQGVTNANGEARSTFTVNSTNCQAACAVPTSGDCEVDLSAEDTSGTYPSAVVVLRETVP